MKASDTLDTATALYWGMNTGEVVALIVVLVLLCNAAIFFLQARRRDNKGWEMDWFYSKCCVAAAGVPLLLFFVSAVDAPVDSFDEQARIDARAVSVQIETNKDAIVNVQVDDARAKTFGAQPE